MNSPGETLFRAYLRQRGFASDYESAMGGRNPDFRVHHRSGDVACEVYEPTITLPEGGGAFSTSPPLRRAFEGRKYKQAKAAQEIGLPFVAVLASTNADTGISPFQMLGAMFGDLGVQIPVHVSEGRQDDDVPAPQGVFGSGARLQPELNRSISAAAVVTAFNPTLWRVEGMIAERTRRGRPRFEWAPIPCRDQRAELAMIQETFEEFTNTGAYDEHARVARVAVLHNPYALIPLSPDVFTGPHDEQWANFEGEEGRIGYGIVWRGPRWHEIPRGGGIW